MHRIFFRFVAAVLIILSSPLLFPHDVDAVAAGPDRPNVLFLCVDDMKDWVNVLGGYEGTVHTPNIDRLAERGMLFRNAHCASPKCAPSRAALLTGMMPSTTGLYDNGHWWYPNLPDVTTIPSHFRSHGYRVVGAGKIFHHTAGNHPPNQWDDFHRLMFREDPWFRSVKKNYPWSQHEPYPSGFPFSGVQGLGHENDWGSLPIAEDAYDDVATADFVIRFLLDEASTSETPFFAACGLFRPHLPWYAPEKFFQRYPEDSVVALDHPEDDLDDLPPEALAFAEKRRTDLERIEEAGKVKAAIRAYLSSITFADEQIGRVLDALEVSGKAKNTVVVLWSDHGWHLGEKRHWHKSTLWEEATRIPLIIDAPGMTPGVCDRPVSLIDLFPTLNQIASLAPIATHDGLSLVPLLIDPDSDRDRPAIIEFLKGNAAVRSQDFRYIRYRSGGEELYDHRSDPNEWHNVAKDPAFAEIKQQLAQWLPASWAESAPTKGAFEFDPQRFVWKRKEDGTVISGRKE